MKRTLLVTLLGLGAILPLSGCAPAVVAGVGAGAVMADDRRTSSAFMMDEEIELKAASQIREAYKEGVHVNATSYNRMVLLTGEVPSEADRSALEQSITKIENVRSTVNELAVMGPALLASLGYAVVGSTGKAAEAEYLKRLGAREVIDRATLAAPGKPLQKDRWACAVDSIGSTTLANVCAQMRAGGTVAACGLAGGMDFPSTVAPFILRGVTLAGIDSVMAPLARREAAWQLLAEHLRAEQLGQMTRDVPLAGAFDVARDILAGRVRGRVVVDVNR